MPEQHYAEIDLNDLTALLLAGVIRVQSRGRSLRAVAGVLFQPRGQFGVQTFAASGGHCMQSIQERQHRNHTPFGVDSVYRLPLMASHPIHAAGGGHARNAKHPAIRSVPVDGTSSPP
ncbi:hypothetical protein [Phyllobacterium sp.]|uniref:hypothetical protein n=1 Tax=unclassified Phyllobacterium TaxID=2638441 RepID=UPI0031FE2E68|nr:hypothetical protein [Phyllobacterium sp.]